MSTYADLSERFAAARAAAVETTTVAAPRRSLLRTVAAWFETRAARRRLLRCCELDPRLAADIGLTSSDLEVERAAPFWRPLRRR